MPSIAHLIHAYGLLVVAGVIGLENVGIPFPGETALIIASVIAGTKHDLNVASVILTLAGASIIGRMIGYVIGREFDYWLLPRYGGYLRITEGRIKLGQYLFLRHGGKIILIAQFVPVCALSPASLLEQPAVHRSEQIAGLFPLALIAPQPRHAHRRAQLPGLYMLFAGKRKARARNTLPPSQHLAPATSARFPRPCEGYRPRTTFRLGVFRTAAAGAGPRARRPR